MLGVEGTMSRVHFLIFFYIFKFFFRVFLESEDSQTRKSLVFTSVDSEC